MSFSRKVLISCFLILAVFTVSMPLDAAAQNTGAGLTPSSQTTNSVTSQSGLISIKAIMATVANVVLSFFAFILGISAIFLDFVLNLTVVELKKNLDEVTAIGEAWKALRDLINLSFIFILLYASIRTILGLESPGKIIKNIVLAALFINFSMFFTRVMIDASNSVALFFYNRLATPVSETSGSVIAGLNARAAGLTNAYVVPLRIQTLYSKAKPVTGGANPNPVDGAPDSWSIFTIGVLGSFMLGLVAFVFLAITIMFVIRYAALVMLLIFSPLGFVKKDLPLIGEYSARWWGFLKSQLLWPPFFMILTWVTLKIINSKGMIAATCAASGNCDLRGLAQAGGAPPDSSAVGLAVNFLIIMTFIIMSLVLSQQTAQKGAEAFSGLYKKASKWAGNAMFGTGGVLGRRTLGALGMAAASSETLKGAASSSRLARMALLGADKLQKSSFDARASRVGAFMKEEAGIDAGQAGGKGGIQKSVEEAQKKLEERTKLFETDQLEKDQIKAEIGEIEDNNSHVFEDRAFQKAEKTRTVAISAVAILARQLEKAKTDEERQRIGAVIKNTTRRLRGAEGIQDSMSASGGVNAKDLARFRELKEQERRNKENEKERKRAFARQITESPISAPWLGKLGSVVNLGGPGVRYANKRAAASIRVKLKEKTREQKLGDMMKEFAGTEEPAAAPAPGGGGTPPGTTAGTLPTGGGTTP
ncbi:MAG TPA: hypothetical protein VJJ27_01695 [Candidatus Paceibacterota bacterium]